MPCTKILFSLSILSAIVGYIFPFIFCFRSLINVGKLSFKITIIATISFLIPLTVTNHNARLTINKFSHTINKKYLHFVDMCSTQLKVTTSHNMADSSFKFTPLDQLSRRLAKSVPNIITGARFTLIHG
jgi:hypothetical protein